tara:strand:- start:1220 stop:1516 length:297 start_codon:yes stop_codon:yes gene_type:complete
MDTRQITEIIILELGLPEWHKHRATLQVWFELMNTWRAQGDPSKVQYTETDLKEIAYRCVEHLVTDLIIEDGDKPEHEAQNSITETLNRTLKHYSPNN